jgi:hypothetical protein
MQSTISRMIYEIGQSATIIRYLSGKGKGEGRPVKYPETLVIQPAATLPYNQVSP